MKRQNPIEELYKRDPELADALHHKHINLMQEFTSLRMDERTRALIESKALANFHEANRCGAQLPECTPAVIYNVVARTAGVVVVWHVPPWHDRKMNKCCVHLGVSGTVTMGPYPIDLYYCTQSDTFHLVSKQGMLSVSGRADADGSSWDEMEIQYLAARRVLSKHPELLAHVTKWDN